MKNGFKKLIALVLAFAMAFSLCACGEEPEPVYDIDVVALLQQAIEEGAVIFDATMYQVTPNRVGDFIETTDTTSAYMYMGNGVHADCLAVFTYTEPATAKEGFKRIETYVTDLKDSYSKYLPEEAAKAEAAYLERFGQYVILCISSDAEAATQVINDFVGQPPARKEEKKPTRIEANGELTQKGGLAVIGDAGYEMYTYVESASKNYAEAINKVAENVSSWANVYNIIAPLSSGITIPDDYRYKISRYETDQKAAIDQIFSFESADVKPVRVFDAINAHRDEYVYFRTDHHWTALGAYYAYEQFCKEKGILPISLGRRTAREFPGFLGSFYTESGGAAAMKANPDTVVAYEPMSEDVKFAYTRSDGKTINWKIISDVSNAPAGTKYSTFVAGDYPYNVITNPTLEGGEKCIVVKESFANAFIPFLVDHYNEIYIIDFRYYDGSVSELAFDKEVDDIIFLTSISMTRNSYMTGKLNGIV